MGLGDKNRIKIAYVHKKTNSILGNALELLSEKRVVCINLQSIYPVILVTVSCCERVHRLIWSE